MYMYLPVDVTISVDFPGSHDASNHHANPGIQKDAKDSRSASWESTKTRAHFKGHIGSVLWTFGNWDKPSCSAMMQLAFKCRS